MNRLHRQTIPLFWNQEEVDMLILDGRGNLTDFLGSFRHISLY